MKNVETPWKGLYKFVLYIFGLPFLVLGIIFKSWALLINGLVWIIIGVGLIIKFFYDRRKLETLKKEGICYNGSVVKIIPKPWIRIGSYVVARVECLYKAEREDRLVKSGYHLLLPFDRKEDLYAKVYLDKNNSEKYIVKIFRRIGE